MFALKRSEKKNSDDISTREVISREKNSEAKKKSIREIPLTTRIKKKERRFFIAREKNTLS